MAGVLCGVASSLSPQAAGAAEDADVSYGTRLTHLLFHFRMSVVWRAFLLRQRGLCRAFFSFRQRRAASHGRSFLVRLRSWHVRARRAAVFAIVGGALWVGKAASILATGDQPRLLFEVAPVFFALALVSLASARGPRAVGLVALVCALGAAAGFVGGWDAVGGPLLGLAVLGVAMGLAWHGWGARREGWSAFVMGVGTIPLVVVGGVLSFVDERVLELPILALGLGWVWMGVRAWGKP